MGLVAGGGRVIARGDSRLPRVSRPGCTKADTILALQRGMKGPRCLPGERPGLWLSNLGAQRAKGRPGGEAPARLRSRLPPSPAPRCFFFPGSTQAGGKAELAGPWVWLPSGWESPARSDFALLSNFERLHERAGRAASLPRACVLEVWEERGSRSLPVA